MSGRICTTPQLHRLAFNQVVKRVEIGIHVQLAPKCQCPAKSRRQYFLNRKELAEVFWERGFQHIGVALSACQVLSMLSIKAKEKKKEYLATDFLDLSSAYEQRAIGVMDACYKEDMLATEDLLRMELKGWQLKSPLTCTSETTLDFLDHTCCENIRTKIWKGEYPLESVTYVVMLMLYSWFVLSDLSRSIVRGSFFGNPFIYWASVNVPTAVYMLITVIFAEVSY
ncbi:hypothetical protein LSAT2_013898 [Lamellibrachia satsuma]|nr:hypothetical protein LSAT2_013898 [Lamellibrachia satsuma]